MKFVTLVALLGVALAGCASETDSGPVVELHSVTFESSTLTVATGTTVTFKVIEASHTVDFAEGQASVTGVSAAHSGNLDPGDTFEVTFTKPGTYPYFCVYHSSLSGGERIGMVGTITVT